MTRKSYTKALDESLRPFGFKKSGDNWIRIRDDMWGGPTLVKLALTLYRMGALAEACEVLRKPVPKTAIPANVEAVERVRVWLGCD